MGSIFNMGHGLILLFLAVLIGEEERKKAINFNDSFNDAVLVSDNCGTTIYFLIQSLQSVIPAKISGVGLSVEIYSLASLQSWQP